MERRPLKSRGTKWAKSFARFLAKRDISPNTISVFSIIFSILACISLYCSHESNIRNYLLVLGAISIQLRLICNLMDGMVAVEYKKGNHLGDIYNDLPDRFSDLFIIFGISLSIRNIPYALDLGYIASIIAILTAYIRVLSASIGASHYFIGPMGKPHRMALLTIVLIFTAIFNLSGTYLFYSLFILIIGGILTCSRRLLNVSKELKGLK